MRATVTGMLPWALAAGVIFGLPCCLVLQLEIHPGTAYLDHLPGTFAILAGGFLLIIRPAPESEQINSLPDAHVDVFRYAVHSGVLPIASLFSDWNDELVRIRKVLTLTLRSLPTATGAVLVIEVYGIFTYSEVQVFFLVSALASTAFSLFAFSRSTIALMNINLIEGRLRVQQHLLRAD
ncbi:hypothetical protein ACFVYC_08770 [Pseudarthrobacter sp. NPDC058329]|uniref:hypothetical protein n=1 Tax=Pseudarthrobacter sp. NPDC058329 TaxID=3346448 RepID=UPI0036DB7238